MGNAPGTPWANYLTFLYYILIESQWKIALELLWQIPSGLLIESLLEINGNALGAPWANSLTFLH